MFDVMYNSISGRSLGLRIAERPAFPAPERNKTFTTVPGRSGSLVTDEETYDDIKVKIKFNFVNTDDTAVSRVFRSAKKWLLSDSGDGYLYVTDDSDIFYIVKSVTISDSDRTAKIGHSFTAEFRLDPYTYYRSGQIEITLPATLYNNNELSEPVYKITGDGVCTITTSAGDTVTANVGQNLTIDCKNRMAYRTDSGTRNNTALTGDIADLCIPSGFFTVSVSHGFTAVLIPNWRAL